MEDLIRIGLAGGGGGTVSRHNGRSDKNRFRGLRSTASDTVEDLIRIGLEG